MPDQFSEVQVHIDSFNLIGNRNFGTSEIPQIMCYFLRQTQFPATQADNPLRNAKHTHSLVNNMSHRYICQVSSL